MTFYELFDFSTENIILIIWARLSSHGLGWMLKVFSTKEQSRAELEGLFAGVAYSAVLMASIVFTLNEVYFFARDKVASPKPCQLVTPLPQ
jgi:hypothetical protein